MPRVFSEAAVLNDCPTPGDQVEKQSDHGKNQKDMDQ